MRHTHYSHLLDIPPASSGAIQESVNPDSGPYKRSLGSFLVFLHHHLNLQYAQTQSDEPVPRKDDHTTDTHIHTHTHT